MESTEGGSSEPDGREEGAPETSPAEATAGLRTSEQLVALGALIIVGVDILGDVILREYFVPSVAWIAAVGALVAVWAVGMRKMNSPISYRWILIVLGFAAAISGFRALVDDLRYDLLDEGVDIIMALIFYAGFVLMGVGAYQAVRDKTLG